MGHRTMMRFHRRCGDRVTLLNDNTTAVRNFVEFNHGLILSADPLPDDVIFEVSIDRKVNLWNGSLEIGVTTLDPEFMELPATATKLRNTAWIMSGHSVVKDGVTIVNPYGPELDSLHEGDRIGVTRTSKGELIFYVNGRSWGVAASDLPLKVFAVIDLYGQCVQVSIMHSNCIMETSLDLIDEDPNNDDTLTSSEMEGAGMSSENYYPKETGEVFVPLTTEGACALVPLDRLRFHPRHGILVTLSNNNLSAERARPLDDYNNGVVMTHRPLHNNELFEIRIDQLVDKWSGSIEVGVTSHNPASIRFPSTMTNMDTGTIMMSGCKVLLNGHGTCLEYGNFNLDELREGDTVGMMRKSNGNLHYFINGIDQGVAANKLEQEIWGVVDLYGMTVKVTIINPCDDIDANVNNYQMVYSQMPALRRYDEPIDENSLLFHTLRDSNVIIVNDGKTAHRPNAFRCFNNGIVMTNRTLKTNELFQVRLDLVIPKWAGSIEIGVTQHSSSEIEFPFKMSNARSGTWAMTGEDVIRDGTIIIPKYVRNLNRLIEGESVGVMRRDTGVLHFFINGIDQGPAAFNIPEHVFGIVDLYGRVAQGTIIDMRWPQIDSPESPLSTESNATIYPEMCFHRVHGRNARLSRYRLTASRATEFSEFNDAVLFSSRPLRECEMFELKIDKMVDCWIGSLEIGVTAIRPDDLDVSGGVGAIAGTATDLNWDTYILSGAAMMKDGECVRSGYPLDLDSLTVGSRVGMMWHADRSLHYYLDGIDMGKAWYVPHLNIYAVVDLYGQCTQVTISQNEERAFNYNGCTNSDNSLLSNLRPLSSPPPPYCSFSEYRGDNISLLYDYSIARRTSPDPMASLAFSSAHLAVNEIFEIKILECKYGYAGSFRMGVTEINILNAYVNRSFPPSVTYLSHYTAYIDGPYIKYTKPGTLEHVTESFVPSFEWLKPGDKIGLKRTSDSRVLVYYNSELLETAFEKVPDKVYVVMELFGAVFKIQVVSREMNVVTNIEHTIPNELITSDNQSENQTECPVNNVTEGEIHEVEVIETNVLGESNETHETVPTENTDSTVTLMTTEPKTRSRPLPYTFHYVHGENIKLCSCDTVAMRTASYMNAVAIVSQPLNRGHNFRFRVDEIDEDWVGSVILGAMCCLPQQPLPSCSIHVEPPVWVVSSDLHNDNGTIIPSDMAAALGEVTEQSMLTIHFCYNSELVIDIDGKRICTIGEVPKKYGQVYPMIDLYGRVSQVSILLHPYKVVGGTSLDLPIIDENLREEFLAELELEEDAQLAADEENEPVREELRKPVKPRAYSYHNLVDEDLETMPQEPGPSSYPDELPTSTNTNTEIQCRNVGPNRVALHHSLVLSDSSLPNDYVNYSIQKSQSTRSFCNVTDDIMIGNILRHTLSLGSRVGDSEMLRLGLFDTNKRHNDRYPEASDVDNLDNEIMYALTLETGNLPDLTEEQSWSIDESTRRDDLWSETMSLENMNYLTKIVSFEQMNGEGRSLESEFEASGCEFLHVALKYWYFLVLPYPEMRQAESWRVHCFCYKCQPNAQPPYIGWVRIERVDGMPAAARAFWHISRAALNMALSGIVDPPALHRPRDLTSQLNVSSLTADVWFDEEDKPHHTVLATEIDIEGSDAENDRLLAYLIYLKPHLIYRDDNSHSSDE